MQLRLHDVFDAGLDLAERNAHVVAGVEAIARLGFDDRQRRKALLAQIRGRKREQNIHDFGADYGLFFLDRSPELSK